mmetsp:Transcript_10985/g.33038  ORF Transcript_10985/g.33038 Transcript_10985/m.33038 type:complete len:98 (+) Transcript_10985:373-666(+)
MPASWCPIKDRLTEHSKSSIFLDLSHKSRCRVIVSELELQMFDPELSLAPWSWIHDKPWSSYSDDVTFTDECRVAYLSEYSDMELIYCHGEFIQQTP